MNLARLRGEVARIRARLLSDGAGQQFKIPAKSGMAGLRAALALAEAARGEAEYDAPVGEPQSPFRALREDILAEQKRRAEWMAALPPNSLGNEPVVEETEEPSTCTAPIIPNPNPSS